MNLATFFDKFEQFADAPNAVAKLRELVLELAVSGRLSEQKVGDAPVSELTGVLSAAKARRGKTGRRGTTTAALVESRIERPVAVPSHWAWVPLNEIGAMSGGMTPSKDKSAFWDGDTNWFSSRDIKTDELLESELKITREATDATGLQVYSPGCLVMVARSGILKRTFPVSILRVEGTVNQDLKVLSPFVPGLDRYLQIMLRGLTPFILTHLVKTGMTVQSLKYEEFEAQQFPLPPFAEQERIVAKVDELMALCDQLEAQQQERASRASALARASLTRFADAPTPANLNFLFHSSYHIQPSDLRKSILTLAVQGKLVPQDPEDEPAEELIARIAALRDAKTAKQFKPVSPDEVPYEVPSSWTWIRMGNIALSSDSGWSPQCLSEARSGTDWGVLKVSAVSWGVFKPNHNKALPPGITSRPECEVKPGDFLLSRANTEDLVARSVVVDKTPPRLMMSDKIVRFTFPMQIERAFINIANTSNPSRAYYARNASGTSSSMKNIGREVMCNLPIPLPPMAEQRRIIAKMEQLMALVDEVETQLAASNAAAKDLLETVVAELTSSRK